MTIEQAIKKATDEGFRLKKALEFNTYQDHLGDFLIDPKFFQCLGKAMGWEGGKIRMCVGCGVALRWNEQPTMDGKHGGKNGCGSDIEEYEGQWIIGWHMMIDHLAEGKTIEEFFKNL